MEDEAKKHKLANLKPFKPGQSGNPGGRSKVQIDVRNAARELRKRRLTRWSRNGKPGEAAMAANSLLDRGWGRATVLAEVAVKTDVRDMSREEILAELATIRTTDADGE